MNKKSTIIVFTLTIFISLNLSAKKKDKYEKWINEEINYIITDAERAEFKKLKKDKDKKFFIKLFWAKRDPTPLTEKNELKEEFYRRLAYVNKAFIYGYNRGSGTDMGKVWLYFGQPARVFRQDPRVEIWVYPTQPWMNIPKDTFSFVFTAVESDRVNREGEEGRTRDIVTSMDRDGYVLNVQQTDSRSIRTFYAYPKVIILHPDLKELPEYRKVISFSPDSFEGKLIQQLESTGEDVIQIPFEKKVLFTKAESLSSYLTFLLKIAPTTEIPDKLTIFGRLKSEVYSADFRREKTLTEENDYFISQVGMPVLPGEYELFVGLYTKDKKIYSLKMEKISIPNFWTKEFSISSLIASPEVQAKQSLREEEFNIFSVGNYSLSPTFGQEYTKEHFLNVFYYIYNFAVDSNKNCSFLIEFELQKGEQNFKLNPQKIQKKVEEGAILLEGTQIPLSVFPESGEYELIVKVTDKIAKKTVSEKLKFFIH